MNKEEIKQLVIVTRNLDIDYSQFINPIYVGVESGSISLLKKKLKIAFLTGDFDSVSSKEYNFILKEQEKQNIKIFKANKEKDYIDAELAIHQALKLKLDFNQIILITEGKRWDMIFAQVNLINKYANFKPILISNNNYVFSINKKESFTFSNYHLNYKYISIFCLNTNKVIYNFQGCKYYNNQDITINNKDVLAVSNEFNYREETKKITIKKGNGLIILFKD